MTEMTTYAAEDYRQFLAHYSAPDDAYNRRAYEQHVALGMWPYTPTYRCSGCGLESENPETVRYCEATHHVTRRCSECGGSGIRHDHPNNFTTGGTGYARPRCVRCGGTGRKDEQQWRYEVAAKLRER